MHPSTYLLVELPDPDCGLDIEDYFVSGYGLFRFPFLQERTVANVLPDSMGEVYPWRDTCEHAPEDDALGYALEQMLADAAKRLRDSEREDRSRDHSESSEATDPPPLPCSSVSFVCLDREHVLHVKDPETCDKVFGFRFPREARLENMRSFARYRPERVPCLKDALPSLVFPYTMDQDGMYTIVQRGLLLYACVRADPTALDEVDMQVMLRCVSKKDSSKAWDLRIAHIQMETPPIGDPSPDWSTDGGMYRVDLDDEPLQCSRGVLGRDEATSLIQYRGPGPEDLFEGLLVHRSMYGKHQYHLQGLLVWIRYDWDIVAVWLSRDVVLWCKDLFVYHCLITNDRKVRHDPQGRRVERLKKVRDAHKAPFRMPRNVSDQEIAWSELARHACTWINASRPLLKDPRGDPRRIVVTARAEDGQDMEHAWMIACRRDVEVWKLEEYSEAFKALLKNRRVDESDASDNLAGDYIAKEGIPLWNEYLPLCMDDSNDFILLDLMACPCVSIFCAPVRSVVATGTLEWCVQCVTTELRDESLEVCTVHYDADHVLFDREGRYKARLTTRPELFEIRVVTPETRFDKYFR
jgi:hypothetical protein